MNADGRRQYVTAIHTKEQIYHQTTVLVLCKLHQRLECNRKNGNLEIGRNISASSNPDVLDSYKHLLTSKLNETTDEENTEIDRMVTRLNEAIKDAAAATLPKV